MSKDPAPVGREELSAYLDGELDESRRAAVERHCADYPEAAATLADYRRRDGALRLAFAEIGHDGAAQGPRRQPGRPASRAGSWAVAAAALCVAAGAFLFWLGPNGERDHALAGLWREAATAHLLYAEHPEAPISGSVDRDRLSARLSALIGVEMKAPDLSALGFQLVGMRELAADGGPAAQLVYRDPNGRRVSCYFKRIGWDRETNLRHHGTAGVHVVYRLDERIGYAVVGSLPPASLARIAEAEYRELTGPK